MIIAMIRIQICKRLVSAKRATPTPPKPGKRRRKSENNDAVKRVTESEGIRDFGIVLSVAVLGAADVEQV